MGGMEYDDDDDDDRRGKTDWSDTRMYAAGVAWAEPSDRHSKHPEHYAKEVDQATAMEWVRKMHGGEKFKLEQTEQQRASIAPDCDKYSFYVAMNMMYSDYNEVARKLNMDRMDFYAWLAKAFLDDKDAKDNKLARYMEEIPK